MSEMIILIEEAAEGGFTGRSLGKEQLFIEGETFDEIRKNALDAVQCHFHERKKMPSTLRLHMVKDELIAV